jgi:hypothetical protein
MFAFVDLPLQNLIGDVSLFRQMKTRRGSSHCCGLAIYIKKYLKAKEEL